MVAGVGVQVAGCSDTTIPPLSTAPHSDQAPVAAETNLLSPDHEIGHLVELGNILL